MKKYFQVMKNTFEEYMVYRLNFVLWRFRSFILLLSLFFFWEALYGEKQILLGYQKSQIITYTLGIAILRSVTLGSRSAEIAGQIKSGEIAGWFLRPIGTLKYWASRDLTDKIINIFFTLIELGIVIAILKPPLFIQTNLFTILAFISLVLLATVLYFILNVLAGATGFWLEDVWAPRFLIMVVFLEFAGGAFFPLDVLPPIFVKILRFTPFPYLVYFPLKVWLGQVFGWQLVETLLVTCLWLVFFYFLIGFVWKKGLKAYDVPGL